MQTTNPMEQIEMLQQRVSQVTNLLVEVTQEKTNLSHAYNQLQQMSAANNQRVVEVCNTVREEIMKSVKEPTAGNLCKMFDNLIGPTIPTAPAAPVETQKNVDAKPVA